jgi:acetyltransferase-like isoleucine patch superfamily enzyme
MNFRYFIHRLVRNLIVGPMGRWYQRTHVIRQLEEVGRLGQGVAVQGSISLGSPATIEFGDDVSLNPGFTVQGTGRLRIGAHVHIGQDVLILTTNHKYEGASCLPYDRERVSKDVVIGDSVWICDRVIITPGVEIGEGAVLAAGAVINRDVPALAVVGGTPAQVIRYRDQEEYQRLKEAGQYLNWPRAFDTILDKRMTVRRRPRS